MASGIHGVEYLQGHISVGVLVQVGQSVAGPVEVIEVSELSHVPSGLESELLENLERSLLVQDADVHDPGLVDHLAGVVGLVDAHHDLGRIGGDLGDRVADHAVVSLAVV